MVVVRNVPDSPSARNAPVTGEASTLSTVSTTVAARRWCRTAISAATPKAPPSRNGIRPLHRLATTLTHASADAASGCRVPRSNTVASAVIATAEIAPTSSVPISEHRYGVKIE